MKIYIENLKQSIQDDKAIEVVEKKGIGHPDSLADGLAEAISYVYSKYCLKNFGYILHHNMDKINVLGGRSSAGFGFGEQLDRIRVIINGRMSLSFGGIEIPVFDIASQTVRKYFKTLIPTLDVDKDIRIFDFINRAGGAPHKGNKWFRPNSVADLPEVKLPRANDTCSVVNSNPYSKIEALSLSIHDLFYKSFLEKKYDYLGTDIKIMIMRIEKEVSITMCIPFLGSKTPDLTFYISKKEELKKMILKHAKDALGKYYSITLDINMRDNPKINDLYILANGTAAESGDEGIVGRGNRSSGFIASYRPYSIEASQGKNPTYFGGKVYDLFTRRLSQELFDKMGINTNVFVMTQNGALLKQPSNIIIQIEGEEAVLDEKKIKTITEKHLLTVDDTWKEIMTEQENLYSKFEI